MDVAVVASTGRTRTVAVEEGNRRKVEEHQVHCVRLLHQRLGLPLQRPKEEAGVGSNPHNTLRTALVFRSNNDEAAKYQVGLIKGI